MKKFINDKKGFTLIELVVVIAILGLLVTVGLPKYKEIRERAMENVDESNRVMLMSSANFAIAENGNPKTSLVWNKDGDSLNGNETIFKSSNFITKWPEYPWNKINKGDVKYEVTIDINGDISIKPDKIVNNNEGN